MQGRAFVIQVCDWGEFREPIKGQPCVRSVSLHYQPGPSPLFAVLSAGLTLIPARSSCVVVITCVKVAHYCTLPPEVVTEHLLRAWHCPAGKHKLCSQLCSSGGWDTQEQLRRNAVNAIIGRTQGPRKYKGRFLPGGVGEFP